MAGLIGPGGFMLSGTAHADYPPPSAGPDGSTIPNLANEPMVLHVNDHGTWKVLTITPTPETVNGKLAMVVTQADMAAAQAHAVIDPDQSGRGPAEQKLP